MHKITLVPFCIAVMSVMLFFGCATQKPVPYNFDPESAETVSISFQQGNPGVSLVYYGDAVLPEAEKDTYWDPVSFPSGKELQLTVHANYSQSDNSSGGFLLALATAAISSSRTVDKDVLFICPPLESGRNYVLSFRKGAGVTGRNLLVLTDTESQKIVCQQEFDSK